MRVTKKNFQKMLVNELLEDIFLFGIDYKIRAYFDNDKDPIDYDVLSEFSEEEMQEIETEKNVTIEIIDECSSDKEYGCIMLAIKFLAKLISSIDEIPFKAAMLKALRLVTGLSLRSFATKIDIASQHVSIYENGTKNFSKKIISKICNALNVPVELFEDDTPFDKMGYEEGIIS